MERYQIDGLGVLGCGTVFMVKRKRDEVSFAMRVTRVEGLRGSNAATKEVRQMMKVEHPNVMRIVDYFMVFSSLDEAQHHVVFPIYQGSLKDWRAARNKVTKQELRPLLSDTLHGLWHLHDLDITHGDIRPTNIHYEETHGKVDFILGDYSVETKDIDTSSEFGSEWILAPENKGTKLKKKNPPSDLWALGVTVCLMVLTDDELRTTLALLHTSHKTAISNLENILVTKDRAGHKSGPTILSMLRLDPSARPRPAESLRSLVM